MMTDAAPGGEGGKGDSQINMTGMMVEIVE